MNLFGFTLPNFTTQAAAAYKANLDLAVATLQGLAGNLLINGDGMINQRASASGIADDTYDCDRWYALTQTGTIAYSQVTAAADNVPFMMRMTQSQASAQRMGRAQIVLGKNCKYLRGQQVTLSLRHKISSAANIRMAILEWTGTEDTVTSDVVNDWTSGTYTGGNFFNSTSLTITGVSSAIAATTALAESSLTVTLGSSFNNLIVMIWTEGTAAQNVTLDLAAQLNPGSVARPWAKRAYEDELKNCFLYFEAQPGVVANMSYAVGYATDTTFGLFPVQFARKRVAPTFTAKSAVGDFTLVQPGVAQGACVSVTATRMGLDRADLVAWVSVAFITANLLVLLRATNTSATMWWDAEL